ncbi:MAG: SH3 domain-containing protein [Paludibacter sp.]
MKKIILSITALLIILSGFGQTRVTTVNIYFRSTPEFAKNKICVIPKGTALTLISGIMQYGDWIPIEYKGKIGYVHAKYVKRKMAKQNKLLTSNH